jgi:hypothetical protein
MKKSRYFGRCKGFAIAGALLMGIGSAFASQSGNQNVTFIDCRTELPTCVRGQISNEAVDNLISQSMSQDEVSSCFDSAMGELTKQCVNDKEKQNKFFKEVTTLTLLAKQVSMSLRELLSSPDSTKFEVLNELFITLQEKAEGLRSEWIILQQEVDKGVFYSQMLQHKVKNLGAAAVERSCDKQVMGNIGAFQSILNSRLNTQKDFEKSHEKMQSLDKEIVECQKMLCINRFYNFVINNCKPL